MEGIRVDFPGGPPIRLTHLLLDFTGTLAKDGALIPGVAERLKALSRNLTVIVLTADTFGTARAALKDLPIEVHLVRTGRDKAKFIEGLVGAEGIAAIGNGRNDIEMLKLAHLGIAVIGPEGCAAELLFAAKIVARDILDALDVVANPLRVKATLRD